MGLNFARKGKRKNIALYVFGAILLALLLLYVFGAFTPRAMAGTPDGYKATVYRAALISAFNAVERGDPSGAQKRIRIALESAGDNCWTTKQGVLTCGD